MRAAVIRTLGVLGTCWVLGGCELDSLSPGGACCDDGGIPSGPTGPSGPSNYTPPDVSGRWLYEVSPQYLPHLTTLPLCTDAALQGQMWAELEIAQTGVNVTAVARGGRGLLAGHLNGRFDPPGGSGILEHEAELEMSGSATVSFGCPGTRVSTELDSEYRLDSNEVSGLIELRVSPDPTQCDRSSSACYVKGTFHFVRR